MPRVFVVSDARLYREGLATILASLGQLSVAAEVAGSDLSLAYLVYFDPDLVLLDMALPGCLGLPAALNTEPPVKFIAFAVSDADDGDRACAEAGFAGYVGRGDRIHMRGPKLPVRLQSEPHSPGGCRRRRARG